MFGIGTPELLILAAVFMLIFGASRLPKMMRSMGQSVGEFKQGLADEPKAIDREAKQEEVEEEVD